MKFSKSGLQMASLLIAVISIIVVIFSIIGGSELFYIKNEFVSCLVMTITGALLGELLFMIFRRINPKQYIYISYTGQDKKLALLISQILSEQFAKLSKYRFEIRTADTIPFGDDMYITMQKYIEESNIIIVIVSEDYINSDWCHKEFMSIVNMNKRIIPIVMHSYDDLSRLPVDISNIKALSLRNCTSEKDFEKQLLRLASDLVRQRKD